MEKTTLQQFEEAIKEQKIWWNNGKEHTDTIEKFAAEKCYDIHSEEVEKHLTRFLDWVDKGTYFFQDKDVTIKQVVSQYMNSYFNQQSKDK